MPGFWTEIVIAAWAVFEGWFRRLSFWATLSLTTLALVGGVYWQGQAEAFKKSWWIVVVPAGIAVLLALKTAIENQYRAADTLAAKRGDEIADLRRQLRKRADDSAAAQNLAQVVARLPDASLHVWVKDSRVLVDVINSGKAQGTFQIRATKELVRSSATFEGAWAEGKQGPRLIAVGDKSTVLLASLEVSDRGFFQWSTISPRIGSGHEYRSQKTPAPTAHVRQPEEGCLTVTLTVMAEPELSSGAARKKVRLRANEAVDDDSGEVFRIEGNRNNLLSL